MLTTKYIWDEQNYLAEADGSDTINVVYTNEPQQYGNLVSSWISGTTSYHHFDALGSTRQLTNGAATTTDTVIYDAWGNVLLRTGTNSVMMLWIGEEGSCFDVELGGYAVRSRRYLSTIARWLSVDPLALLLDWDAEWKRQPLVEARHRGAGRVRRREVMNALRRGYPTDLYAYARNNPIRFTDPSGLAPWSPVDEVELVMCACGVSAFIHLRCPIAICSTLCAVPWALFKNGFPIVDQAACCTAACAVGGGAGVQILGACLAASGNGLLLAFGRCRTIGQCIFSPF